MASVSQTFTVNSLANIDLVGNISKPPKYLQLFLLYWCHPLVTSPVRSS